MVRRKGETGGINCLWVFEVQLRDDRRLAAGLDLDFTPGLDLCLAASSTISSITFSSLHYSNMLGNNNMRSPGFYAEPLVCAAGEPTIDH